ncbi:large ribosomal subunit protein bL33m isoform X3 [Macaca fascicularis]|uniref:large ribosomal subunit protein bL33m isoform X3 n=1 Tax=Macaca fascicularis TaxID=9541 RepID=UPI0032B06252
MQVVAIILSNKYEKHLTLKALDPEIGVRAGARTLSCKSLSIRKRIPTSTTKRAKHTRCKERRNESDDWGAGSRRGAWPRRLPDVLFRNWPVPRKQLLFVGGLLTSDGDCPGVVTMFLSVVFLKQRVLFVEDKKIRSL